MLTGVRDANDMARYYLIMKDSVTMRFMRKQACKPQLPGMTATELTALLTQWGEPRFRAKQILDWRNKGILKPGLMSNLPIHLRNYLEKFVDCCPLRLVRRETSRDGTRKYVFSLHSPRMSGKMIESVMIPENNRVTVCLSSQVGCVLDCPFCHTGTQGFTGNLNKGEIIAQVLGIMQDLNEDPLPPDLHQNVTHIVYMGMGEPLANESGVHGSLALLLDPEGLNISRRRITVSTSGLIPQIERLGAHYPVNLAISLHAADDKLRDVLVPINRKYPLADLRRCLDRFPLGHQRHITLEYVLLDQVNDRECDLEALSRFVRPHRERVNLIQFNPYPGSPYSGTPKERMNEFAQRLISKGIRATVRRSRGQDIMAACGQLKADVANKMGHRVSGEEN